MFLIGPRFYKKLLTIFSNELDYIFYKTTLYIYMQRRSSKYIRQFSTNECLFHNTQHSNVVESVFFILFRGFFGSKRKVL